MNTFITKLEKQLGLDLSDLHMGIGKQGMAFAADLTGNITSLAELLSDLGLKVPNKGKELKPSEVQVAIGYEARRGSPDYQTVVKVTLIGPLQLNDLFEGIDISSEIIPEVDKIQLRFEEDKTGKGSSATTAKEIHFELSYTLASGHGPNILAGVYQHFTQGSNEVKGIAGGIHSAGNPLADITDLPKDIGQLLDFQLTHPFFVHLKDNFDDVTLVGASIDLSAGLPISADSRLHGYLGQGSLDIKHGLAIYSNAELSKSAETWANELLRNVGLPPLHFTSSLGVKTSISEGTYITGYTDLTHPLSIEGWIDSCLKAYIEPGTLKGIDKLFPPLSITEIFFGYHSGGSISLGAKAFLQLKNDEHTQLPLEFRASEASGWTIESKTLLTKPLPLNYLLNGLLGSFDLGSPFHSMGLDVVSMDVDFSINSGTIGFELGLDKAGAPKKLNPDKADDFFVRVNKSSTSLELQLQDGMNLGQLLGFVGPLFGLEDLTLDEVLFSMNLANGKSNHTNYSLKTTFHQNEKRFEIDGALDKHSTGSTTTSLIGGCISFPEHGSLNLKCFLAELDIKQLFFASIVTSNSPALVLFHADFNLHENIDLGDLPVLGKFLSEAQFELDLNVSYASGPIKATALNEINRLLHPLDGSPFNTAQPVLKHHPPSAINFSEGLSLQGALILGDHAERIPLHTQYSGGTGENGNAPVAQSKPGHLGKQYGPIILDSVSLASRDGGMGLKFTGGMKIGPVTFELINFEITSPLNVFEPEISIDGLGLDIKKGALNLEGLLMKKHFQIPDKNGNPEEIDGFSGQLVIDYKQYSLAALGSYAQLKDGTPSLFLYAFLGTPLGGPPVFFVTGIAAGFGYNRTLELPAPSDISTYALIEPVIGSLPTGSLESEFQDMNMHFIPKEGAFWGAIGVRGESFKMVESFILLDVQFNESIEVDLIGISNMTFPTPKEAGSEGNSNNHPLAKVIIGIVARYIPEQGVLTIKGAFQPGTFILNPKGHITGSFGLLSVFDTKTSGFYDGAKAGEFVMSIGGYPAHYPVKSYYPNPQRIRLNWQVNPFYSIKASGYFAITPDAMMAGGVFEALYRIGTFLSISASYTLAADFIIYWKPYHYTADISLAIDVKASINIPLLFFTLHIRFNMEFGADLQVWGPPFAGKGQLIVHAAVTFSVDVSFGKPAAKLEALKWPQFLDSFLPKTDQILTAGVGSGLISTVEHSKKETADEEDEEHTKTEVINPKEMSLVCHTAFPLTGLDAQKGTINGSCSDSFGIAPMGKLSELSSILTINITKGSSNEPVEDQFDFNILTRSLPAAMWAKGTQLDVPEKTYGKGLIHNLACGVEIVPSEEATASNPTTIDGVKNDPLYTPAAPSYAAFDYKTAGFTMKHQTT